MTTSADSVLELIRSAAAATPDQRMHTREQVLALGDDVLLALGAAHDDPDARVRVLARAWAGWIAAPETYASIEQSFDAPSDAWFATVARQPPSRESVESDLLWPPGDVAGLIGEIVMNRGDSLAEHELEGCVAALGRLHQSQPTELIEDLYLSLANRPEMAPAQHLLLHVMATDAPPDRRRLRELVAGPISPRQALAVSLLLEALPDPDEGLFPDSGGR